MDIIIIIIIIIVIIIIIIIITTIIIRHLYSKKHEGNYIRLDSLTDENC